MPKQAIEKKVADVEEKTDLIDELDFQLQKCRAELESKISESNKLVKGKAVLNQTLEKQSDKIKLLENTITHSN